MILDPLKSDWQKTAMIRCSEEYTSVPVLQLCYHAAERSLKSKRVAVICRVRKGCPKLPLPVNFDNVKIGEKVLEYVPREGNIRETRRAVRFARGNRLTQTPNMPKPTGEVGHEHPAVPGKLKP